MLEIGNRKKTLICTRNSSQPLFYFRHEIGENKRETNTQKKYKQTSVLAKVERDKYVIIITIVARRGKSRITMHTFIISVEIKLQVAQLSSGRCDANA